MSGIFTSLQISKTLFLIIPVKKKTDETRGPSGGFGDREAAIQRDPEDEEAVFAPAGFCCFAQLASWEERWGHTCWLAFSKAQLRPSGNHCRGRSGKALFLAPN